MDREKIRKYDMVIVGGGVTGTALLYALGKYTNLSSIALVEKYSDFAEVNSNNASNSQTLHFGDIETNYSLEKALVVKEAAEMVEKYLLKTEKSEGLIYKKSHKMVLAVGEKEVKNLEKRFEEFKNFYPKLKLLSRKEIEEVEPLVVKKRNAKEKICALISEDGYIVDYKALSKSFVENALKEKGKDINIFLNTRVNFIIKNNGGYVLKVNNKILEARAVIFAAGAHSLFFAKSLGYGKQYFLLPVAGNFYAANQKLLNGKVYTMQKDKLPFAAVHGDPNILDLGEVRFGPTAKVIPVLERKNIKTFGEFFKTTKFDFKVVETLFKIIADRDISGFIVQNMIYDIPFLGKYFYMKAIKKIVPDLSLKNLEFKKVIGGIRPQLADREKKELIMGVGEIVGDNIIFNITPSPGATACLQAAQNTAKKLSKFFGKDFMFNEDRFKNDFLENK